MSGDEDQSAPIASKRHTLILGGILLGLAAAGLMMLARQGGGSAPAASGGAPLYLGLIAAEWGLFLYVRAGLRARGTTVGSLISGRPLTARNLAVDLLVGAVVLALFIGAEWLLGRLLGAGDQAGVQPLLVRRAAEIPLWILLSLSAGIVEEFVFRGYFQRQLGALLGSPWLGLVAQALLFGVSHGYQGGVQMLKISLLGLLFGLAALLRRSLVPGMAAHAAADMIGGLAALR